MTQGIDFYMHNENHDPLSQQALPVASPSLPHSSQQRRYTDSAVSLSTVTSNDKHSQTGHPMSPQLSNMSDFDSFNASSLQPPPPGQSTGFSPGFSFSPLPQSAFDPALFGLPPENTLNQTSQPKIQFANYGFDPSLHAQPVVTPGAASHSGSNANEEKDPFLTLLEQLAENEHSRGGPSDLDFFLDGQEG